MEVVNKMYKLSELPNVYCLSLKNITNYTIGREQNIFFSDQ